ncbi:MAG: MBL fold metallo-hydrolase [Candidatus Methanomethylophilaceae archaeon]|jgi:glyoxylase-like metal-dependent hydrolase (beta-lactamase superfamily II)|nr:MBL fold metallo-hydrolase [Candidatus Methanomethylophilaceae archaeon]NLF33446.1 MBL fold metallo-hydrolase [Thermoplasmatales archaeon]
MINLDVLVIGSLGRDADGGISFAHSTSTLIRAPGRSIVVDTSTREMRPAMKTSFRQIGVFPEDVDTVVLTHCHYDHTENLDMFPNARVLLRAEEAGAVPGAVPVEEDAEIAEGIRLIHTPGHTPGSMSVFVDADVRYALAGDALPLRENFEKMVPPRTSLDPDLAMKSIKRITKYADVVVPGHGPPFSIR